jgi:hypothetical protein
MLADRRWSLMLRKFKSDWFQILTVVQHSATLSTKAIEFLGNLAISSWITGNDLLQFTLMNCPGMPEDFQALIDFKDCNFDF